MAIEQLVVNGCSYMELYTKGNGHIDLAHRLELGRSVTMALGGSCNSRILRSTLKHSYQSNCANLYVLGLTFLHRWEITVAQPTKVVWDAPSEGRWINPQSIRQFEKVPNWTNDDTETWAALMFKSYVDSEFDYLEDLVYRVSAVQADLYRRGHRLLCFNTINQFDSLTSDDFDKLAPAIDSDYIIDRFQWKSNCWQREQGAAYHDYGPDAVVPPECYRHIAEGEHGYLNHFLTEYIQNRGIIS